jgi:upstream activation factor subunit UAF30
MPTRKAPSGKAAASGKAAPPSPGGTKPNALQQPLQPSKELAAVVGAESLPRGEVVRKVWAYSKAHSACPSTGFQPGSGRASDLRRLVCP